MRGLRPHAEGLDVADAMIEAGAWIDRVTRLGVVEAFGQSFVSAIDVVIPG